MVRVLPVVSATPSPGLDVKLGQLRHLLMVVTFAVCGLVSLVVPKTFAQFSAMRASASHTFAGAVFSPKTAPVVAVLTRKNSTRLSWDAVTISSGQEVAYVVVRISSSGNKSTICTGRNAPTVSSGTVSCVDDKPGSNPTYTEQPYVFVNSQTTWTLAPSVAD